MAIRNQQSASAQRFQQTNPMLNIDGVLYFALSENVIQQLGQLGLIGGTQRHRITATQRAHTMQKRTGTARKRRLGRPKTSGRGTRGAVQST